MGDSLRLGLKIWKSKNPERPEKGFLPQHDELFKFQESYEMESTWKTSTFYFVRFLQFEMWSLRCSVLGGVSDYAGEIHGHYVNRNCS
jgi:hypothetical protein